MGGLQSRSSGPGPAQSQVKVRRVQRPELTDQEIESAMEKHQTYSGNLWGVTREQFEMFVDLVKYCHEEDKRALDQTQQFITGEFTNRHHIEFYEKVRFDNPGIGPNMYQVNKCLIQPVTSGKLVLEPCEDGSQSDIPTLSTPGVSWAMMCNPDGAECSVFVSHAWAEGIFEFASTLLSKWHRETGPAYICFLANPQNLNISTLLSGAASETPFALALRGPAMTEVIMVGNSNVAIHKRLWCVYEAFVAKEIGKPVMLAGASQNFVTNPEFWKCSWIARIFFVIIFVSYVVQDAQNAFHERLSVVRLLCKFLQAVSLACGFREFFLSMSLSHSQWRSLDPQRAECSNAEDMQKITNEIQHSYGGMESVHVFMDDLLHYNPLSNNAIYCFVYWLLFNPGKR